MSLRTWFNSSPASGSADPVSSAVAARTRRATARRSWRSRLGLGGGALSGGAGPVFGRTPVAAESLESRTLLTILVGGDEFYYRDFDDNVNRIRLEGNIRVEVVGSEVNEDNGLTLRNLAGRLYRPGPNGVPVPIELNGGLRPEPGTQLIGAIAIQGGTPVANPTINAIAADADGDLFAFNVIELEDDGGGGGGGTQDTAQIQLLQLTIPAAGSGTVIATVIEDDLGAAQGFTNVTGADFNPDTGQLFIAVSVEDGGGGAGGQQDGSLLYSLDVNDPNPGGTLGFIGAFTSVDPGQGAQPVEVSSIAFFPTPFGYQLAGIADGGIFTGGPGGVTANAIEVVSGDAGGGGGGGGEVNGIEYNPFTGDFLGVGAGDVEAPVLNICLNGRAIGYGPLGTANLSSLTFIPGLPDPFTFNTDGSFVAFDTGNDNFYYVDPTNRVPRQSIYNIYVLESDPTGGIAIGFVHTIDELEVPPNSIFDPMQPFTESAGPFNVFNLNFPTPNPLFVDVPNSGRVLIGAETQPGCDEGIIEDVPIDVEAPIPPPGPGAPPAFPNLPPGITSLRPGLTMNPGQHLGKFFLGGTIMGAVNVGGSIDQFYAGWVLTGNAGGQTSIAVIDQPENFHVAGDLRSLYTVGPLGTDPVSSLRREDPNYVTGFDMQVDGTLGHVLTLDAIYGSIEVDNRPEDDPNIGFVDWPQREMEFKTINTAPVWDSFIFSGNAGFFNDTFETAEFRGSISTLGQDDMVRASGILQATPVLQDFVDFYGVGVMAGQTVGVQLFTEGAFGGANGGGGVINVGVFDPDGRLIATDYSSVRAIDLGGEYFEFTADRPGVYRFAIAQASNALFTNAASGLLSTFPYELRITNTGDIGIGGITPRTQMFPLSDLTGTDDHAPGEDPGIELRNGDLGAVYVGNEFWSGFVDTIVVENGNLRTIDANSLGYGTRLPNASWNFPVNVDVPSGSVGLVRARNPDSILWFNTLFIGTAPKPIGGDFQMLDAAGSAEVFIRVDGGIGTIRADDFVSPAQSFFFANADNTGSDGIIDLIDCADDFGTIGAGPGISTGEGGNVRYMRVGGDVFADPFFGSGGAIETQTSPGEILSLTDDSGSTLTFTPSLEVRNPAFDPVNNPTVPEILAPDASLIVRAYPIRGSGGVAVIDITSDNSVTIDGSGNFGDATAEIGAVIVNGQGAAVLHSNTTRVVPLHPRRSRNSANDFVDFTNPFDPINPGSGGGLGEPDYQSAPNPIFFEPEPVDTNGDGTPDPTRPQPTIQRLLDVVVGGGTRVDIFDIIGGFDRTTATRNGDTFTGQFNRIVNTTGGEIVNITAVSVGEIISDGDIGLATPYGTPTAVLPIRLISGPNTVTPVDQAGAAAGLSPFWNQRIGVRILGDAEADEPGNVVAIRTKRAIGNIIVGGSIGQVVADSDGNHNSEDDVFEGIAGVLWADGAPDENGADLDPGGDIYNVDVGEGIAWGGSGYFSRAGIFANRRIDTITGTNATIRGDIHAGDDQTESYESVAPPVQPPPAGGGVVPPPTIGSGAGGRELIQDSIGRILLTRNSSIINADISVSNTPGEVFAPSHSLIHRETNDDLDNPFYEIGRIMVSNGGGILGSYVSANDIGNVIVKNGFGVFTTLFSQTGDGRLRGVEADGYGIRGVVRDGGASQNYLVARGDGSTVSTTRYDQEARRSERFTIDPIYGTVPNPLTDIHSILGSSASQPEIPGRTDTGIIEDTALFMQGTLDRVSAYEIRANNPLIGTSTFNVGRAINQVHVRHQINGLALTTGTMKVFNPRGDVFNLAMTVAGPIKSMVINGDLANNSQIVTNGKVGNMNNVWVKGRLEGTLRANGKIGKLRVDEAITGRISATRKGKGNAVDQLIIGGPLGDGGLEIEGNVGKIIAAQDLGRTGENLFIRGSIKSLQVNGNLFANVIVRDKLNSLKIAGSMITGSTVSAQHIGSVSIGGDFQAGAKITANKLGKTKITGQLLGDIVVPMA